MKDAPPSRHDREEARKGKRELPLHTSDGRAAGQGMPGMQYPQKNTDTRAICIQYGAKELQQVEKSRSQLF